VLIAIAALWGFLILSFIVAVLSLGAFKNGVTTGVVEENEVLSFPHMIERE
jgi:hypothetical protein